LDQQKTPVGSLKLKAHSNRRNTASCAEEGNEVLVPVQKIGCKCKVCQSLTLHTKALYEN